MLRKVAPGNFFAPSGKKDLSPPGGIRPSLIRSARNAF